MTGKIFRSQLKTVTFHLAAMLCAASIMLPAKVHADTSASATNKAAMGAVDIEYVQTESPADRKVLPGQNIPLAGKVVNLAESAWIRVRVDCVLTDPVGNALEQNLEDEDILLADDSSWKKIGEYYYRLSPMSNNDSADFIKGVHIPDGWTDPVSGATLSVDITAEAVQEKHFTPNFDSEDPWFGTVIETFDAEGYTLSGGGSERFSIVTDRTSCNLIAAGDDFFSNWAKMMPGDVLKGELVIANRMKIPVRIYFRTSTGSPHRELLEALHITIRNADRIIYDGNMAGDVDPEILLMEYAPGQSSVMSYELTVPAALNNAYGLKDLTSIWTFRAEVVEGSSSSFISKVMTGDQSGAGIYLMMTASCTVVMMIMLRKKRGMWHA